MNSIVAAAVNVSHLLSVPLPMRDRSASPHRPGPARLSLFRLAAPLCLWTPAAGPRRGGLTCGGRAGLQAAWTDGRGVERRLCRPSAVKRQS